MLPVNHCMIRTTLPFLLAAALCAQAPEAAAPRAAIPAEAMASILQKELLAHATWLAADERGGRLTGSPGQEAAAEYIAHHFSKLGLEPLGDEAGGKRSFQQRYGVTRTYVDGQSQLQLGGLVCKDGFSILGGKPVEL